MRGEGPWSVRRLKEAGATVALNVCVRDLNLDAARQDERRIEVIANGLPIWGGAQVAVHNLRVSPHGCWGPPAEKVATLSGRHPASRAARRSAPTPSSLALPVPSGRHRN